MRSPTLSARTRFSPAAVGAFELVFRPWMKMRLDRILMAGLAKEFDTDRPLLLVANHVSWWDGFIVREVQRRLRPGGPMYSVMSEPELARRPFLRWMGAIGIQPHSPRLVRAALRRLEALCQRDPRSTVLYCPQGRIWPSHKRPLGFEAGIGLFAKKLDGVVLPLGIHLEPLNRPTPTVFVSLGDPLPAASGVHEIEAAVEFEVDLILNFLARAGEEAPRLWPGPAADLRSIGPRPQAASR